MLTDTLVTVSLVKYSRIDDSCVTIFRRKDNKNMDALQIYCDRKHPAQESYQGIY